MPESQQADKPDAGLTKADVAFNRCHDQSHYGDATTCWRAFLQSEDTTMTEQQRGYANLMLPPPPPPGSRCNYENWSGQCKFQRLDYPDDTRASGWVTAYAVYTPMDCEMCKGMFDEMRTLVGWERKDDVRARTFIAKNVLVPCGVSHARSGACPSSYEVRPPPVPKN